MLGYSLFACSGLRRRLAEAVPLRDRIFLCDGIPEPFVLGVFRPSIYLPSDLTEKEQEYVLLHEACHIRGRDPVWKALGYLAFVPPLVQSGWCGWLLPWPARTWR